MPTGGFQLTAEVVLEGPKNVSNVRQQIVSRLRNIQADIKININKKVSTDIDQLNKKLGTLNQAFINVNRSGNQAANAIDQVSAAIQRLNKRTTTNIKKVVQQKKGYEAATNEIAEFGRQSALAIRRYSAFVAATGIFFGLARAIKGAVGEAFEFEKEVIKISQILDTSTGSLRNLTNEVSRLSTSLGISSLELIKVSRILAQTGLTATETKVALEAIAKASLAPTFGDMESTAMGAIAAMNQFGIEASELEAALGGMNAIAKRFPVESSELIAAIKRAGGVFASTNREVVSGIDALEEFEAIFTSVESTTRETATTIATGLRTIFARLRRGTTQHFLREYGIELSSIEGNFVGTTEAFRRLSSAMKELDPRSLRYAKILEELGGLRQIGKLIPAIENFAVAEEALKVAQEGRTSITKDSTKALEALGRQFEQVRQDFIKLIREITETTTFRILAQSALELARALITLADSIKPLIPLLAIIGGAKAVTGGAQLLKGFGAGVLRRQSGGLVPYGYGGGDIVPAFLEPGEYVLDKETTRSIGRKKLDVLSTTIHTNKPTIQQRGFVGRLPSPSRAVGLLPPPGGATTPYQLPSVAGSRALSTNVLGLPGRGHTVVGGPLALYQGVGGLNRTLPAVVPPYGSPFKPPSSLPGGPLLGSKAFPYGLAAGTAGLLAAHYYSQRANEPGYAEAATGAGVGFAGGLYLASKVPDVRAKAAIVALSTLAGAVAAFTSAVERERKRIEEESIATAIEKLAEGIEDINKFDAKGVNIALERGISKSLETFGPTGLRRESILGYQLPTMGLYGNAFQAFMNDPFGNLGFPALEARRVGPDGIRSTDYQRVVEAGINLISNAEQQQIQGASSRLIQLHRGPTQQLLSLIEEGIRSGKALEVSEQMKKELAFAMLSEVRREKYTKDGQEKISEVDIGPARTRAFVNTYLSTLKEVDGKQKANNLALAQGEIVLRSFEEQTRETIEIEKERNKALLESLKELSTFSLQLNKLSDLTVRIDERSKQFNIITDSLFQRAKGRFAVTGPTDINVFKNIGAFNRQEIGGAFSRLRGFGLSGDTADTLEKVSLQSDQLIGALKLGIQNIALSDPRGEKSRYTRAIELLGSDAFKDIPKEIINKYIRKIGQAETKVSATGGKGFSDQFDSIVNSLSKDLEDINKVTSQLFDVTLKAEQEFVKAINKRIELENQLNQGISNVTQIQFARRAARFESLGRRMTLGQRMEPAEAGIRQLTGGLLDPNAIKRSMDNLSLKLEKAVAERKLAKDATVEEIDRMTKDRGKLILALGNHQRALEMLSRNTLNLANIQNEMAMIQKRRTGTQGALAGFMDIFSGQADFHEYLRGRAAEQAVRTGDPRFQNPVTLGRALRAQTDPFGQLRQIWQPERAEAIQADIFRFFGESIRGALMQSELGPQVGEMLNLAGTRADPGTRREQELRGLQDEAFKRQLDAQKALNQLLERSIGNLDREALNQFSDAAIQLKQGAEAISNISIPDMIQHEMNGEIKIIHSGAELFKNLEPLVQEWVEARVLMEMENRFNTDGSVRDFR